MMNYAKYIDHTLLKADAKRSDIKQLCEEAKIYHFASVCVNPSYIAYCHDLLKDSDVLVCSVIGFPLGATASKVKAFETSQAIEDGADEIDMVINIGALKDGYDDIVLEDIKAVVFAARGKTVKVIIETCLLSDEEIVKACHLTMQANAHFVKTSTGFSTSGATIHAVDLMKKTVKGQCKVKASGGIRCFDDMLAMIEAGADRIGTSAGVGIMKSVKNV